MLRPDQWQCACVALCLSACASVSSAARPEPSPQRSALPAPAASSGAIATPPKPQAPADCPKSTALDAAQLEQEATCLLSRYVQIDTSNPPGNELAATNFLRQLLEHEGIPAQVVESAPGRANLIARLQSTAGTGAAKAIALASHMDVVPAVASAWTVPPFAATLKDGMLWGRGTLDDKAGGVLSLLTLLMAKRLNVALPYDLVFLALADEEAGGAAGSRFLTSQHPELLQDIAVVMNEGGGIIEQPDGKPAYQVEVAQKAPLWLRVIARGPAGHGAAPGQNTAPARLARALARLADYSFPISVLPQVQELYARKAASLPEALRDGARDLRAALQRPAYRKAFLGDPHHAALVHNTLAITMLHGSDKENVIPGEASAVLDMRLLPGQEADAVRKEVVRVIADPEIQLETLLSWTAHSSSSDTPLFHAIEAQAAARDPGAPVLANVIGGFTDCNAFRAIDIACYGYMPLRLAPDAFAGIHGNDERVKVASLGAAVVSWLELLQSVHQ